jgi:hypothetical protein
MPQDSRHAFDLLAEAGKLDPPQTRRSGWSVSRNIAVRDNSAQSRTWCELSSSTILLEPRRFAEHVVRTGSG